MATKEQRLEKELASIKDKKHQAALKKAAELQADIALVRDIQLADGKYCLTFNNHDDSMPRPSRIVEALKGKAFFVRHEWDGAIRDLFNGTIASVKDPKTVFEPIDKGRPSTVFCTMKGEALFSFTIYEDMELAIYPIGEVHAW